jgi:hypothetical protein
MNRYRYTGSEERVFPSLRPSVIGPGDVITAADNPHPYWFELEPENKPTPSARVDEEDA